MLPINVVNQTVVFEEEKDTQHPARARRVQNKGQSSTDGVMQICTDKGNRQY